MKVLVEGPAYAEAMRVLFEHNFLIQGLAMNGQALITSFETDERNNALVETLLKHNITPIQDMNVLTIQNVYPWPHGNLVLALYYCFACAPSTGTRFVDSLEVPPTLADNHIVCAECGRVLRVRQPEPVEVQA